MPHAQVANSQFSVGKVYFGGKIMRISYCFCAYSPPDFGLAITIFDASKNRPVSLKFNYLSATGLPSMLRANYNIFTTGVSVLGSANAGGSCYKQATFACVPDVTIVPPIEATIDSVIGVGTSLR